MKKLKLVQIVAIQDPEHPTSRYLLYGLDAKGKVWEHNWMQGDTSIPGWTPVNMNIISTEETT